MPSLDLAAALHAERHAAGGPDPLTPSAIGAAPSEHKHTLAQISDASYHGRALMADTLPAMQARIFGAMEVLSDTDLDTVLTSGVRYTFRDNTNLPPGAGTAGYLEVQQYNIDAYAKQVWTSFAPSSIHGIEQWVRLRVSGTWRAWEPITTIRRTGQPNGSAQAPQGSEYIDLAATAGARKWIKASGGGTTGWEVVDGDTGWRRFELQNGWTGDLYMRRTANVVHMIVMNVNGANATNSNLYNSTPGGFRCGPLFPVYGTGPRTATNGTVGYEGAIGLTGGSANQILRASTPSSGWTGGSASMVFTTTEPWPTSLPGTPA